MKKIAALCGALITAAAGLVVTPTAVAQDRCPAVVILAARGSGQNGGYE